MVELTIEDKNEILRFSGYRKGVELTPLSEDQLKKCVERVNAVAAIRTNWKLFDIEWKEEGVLLTGTGVLLRGESIKRHLAGLDQAVLMCGTIGPLFDREVQKVLLKDAAEGIYMNSCGVVLVEKVMDRLQETINEALPKGHTGLRFSPGYGDLPLETQKDFMKLLDMERTTGIRLGSNLLMNPEKSVTAVSGIRHDDRPESYEV